MYCKKCGKQIADDSNFCRYCGTLVLVGDLVGTNNPNEISKLKSEIVVPAKEESPVRIEIVKKSTIKKSTVANEIIANVKMLGIAFIMWIVYIMFFSIVHQKDIKPMNDSSWYGESCYDPSSLSGNWIMDWQTQYAIEVLMAPDYSKLEKPLKGFDARLFELSTTLLNPSEYSLVVGMSAEQALNYANGKAKDKQLNKKIQDSLKKEAIEKAKQDKESFYKTITGYRRRGWEDDFYNNMVWAAIITISLSVLGRYIIKFWKWVIMN